MSEEFTKLTLPAVPDRLFPSFYDALNIQQVVVLDMNHDGHLDILFHIWGNTETSRQALTNEPVPDALIAYLSDGDGGYYIGNEEVFGKEKVELVPATSRQFVVDDLNSDGYLDIAYAMNLEDGRPLIDPPMRNWWSDIGVVLSNGDGTYQTVSIPIQGYHHTISTIRIDDGNPYIFTAGIEQSSGGYSAVVRLEGGGWKQYEILPGMAGARNISISNDLTSPYTTHIFEASVQNFSTDVMSGFRSLSADWEIVASNLISSSESDGFSFLAWNAISPSITYPIVIDGQRMVDVAIWEASTLRLYRDKPPIALALLSGSVAPTTNDGEVIRQVDLQPFGFFVGYELVDNDLRYIDDLVVGQKLLIQGYKWKVADLNFDGYDDLVGHSDKTFSEGGWTNPQPVMVYINNQAGQLVYDDSYAAKYAEKTNTGDAQNYQRTLMADFNSDGIMDLLYYTTGPKTWGLNAAGNFGNIVINDIAYIQLGTKSQYELIESVIVSTVGNDQLHGSPIADHINGQSGNDEIFAGNGDDTINGGAGNDLIYGGDGIDTAVFEESSANIGLIYIKSSGKWQVGNSGDIDLLKDIETLQLADKSIPISAQSHDDYSSLPDDLWFFFLVAFNGAPGVTYMDWMLDRTGKGKSIEAFVDVFVTAPQFKEVYPDSMTNLEFATKLVANTLKGTAEPVYEQAVVSKILGMLDSGSTRSNVIFNAIGDMKWVSTSSPIWGKTAQLFENQKVVAKFYTDVMSQSTTDEDTLRSVVANVKYDTDLSTETKIIELIGASLLGNFDLIG